MKHKLSIHISKIELFKATIKTLSKILTNVNIICYSDFKTNENNININVGGIKIAATNESKSTLIYFRLEAKNLIKFNCPNKVFLGINLVAFYKIIKMFKKNDLIILHVDEENENVLKIHDGMSKIFNLELLNLPNETIDMPEIEIESHIILESYAFHKICKEMYEINNIFKLKCSDDSLIFKCSSKEQEQNAYESKEQKIYKFNTDNQSVDIEFNSKKIIKNKYELKDLIMCSDFQKMCQCLEMFIRDDFPLVIKYSFNGFGRLFLNIMSVNDIDMNNNIINKFMTTNPIIYPKCKIFPSQINNEIIVQSGETEITIILKNYNEFSDIYDYLNNNFGKGKLIFETNYLTNKTIGKYVIDKE